MARVKPLPYTESFKSNLCNLLSSNPSEKGSEGMVLLYLSICLNEQQGKVSVRICQLQQQLQQLRT